ncbi:synergin gamma-like [Cotesia glomerata]|uniref:EH domain-containing protein n=1 Tax=Cotesia glomerata TaxID=32391 RepID=A0AAV7IYL8_COTGL|nr:synergin gamma-like [Cotesia glomerata]KAH0560934.1 hypothetical protein KQX54_010126 [Cotesia glomerata]
MNQSRAEKKQNQLPAWLWPTSNVLPSMYRKVWDTVKEESLGLGAMQGELLVDTNKVFPLLLTSQLPTEVLGYIWSLANQKYAGQLTEQELYIVLALTAIAQTSYTFTNLDVLHMLPGPPIPQLNLNILYSNALQSPISETSFIGNLDNKHDRRSNNKNLNAYPSTILSVINNSSVNEPKIDQKMSNVLVNKSCVDEKVISVGHNVKAYHPTNSSSLDLNDDFTDFQSAPIPQISNTSNTIKWDYKQGSAIGSRLANHNLSGGMNLIEKKKTNSNKSNHGNLMESPVLNKDRPIDHHSNNLFSKCIVKNQAKTVILKDTIIRSNSETVQQQIQNNSREVNIVENIENTPVPEVLPNIPAVTGLDNLAQDLMNLQPVEDKYSALRVLVEEPSKSTITEGTDSDLFDDFGDFVSAEQSAEPEVSNNVQISIASVDDSMDLFTDFEQFLPSVNDKEEISFTQETIEAFAQLEITVSPEKTLNFLEKKYEVTIDPEKVMQKEDIASINSIELGNGRVITRSNSVPSLDLKSFLPANFEEDKETENMYQLIYWEWKQYMESCVLLLQVAANIFTNISSDKVLQEVLNSGQGYNFLCNLAEVASVCRRVNFAHKEMDINIMNFDDLLTEIDRLWAQMEPFYSNIPIVTELPTFPQHPNCNTACALCLTAVTSNKVTYNDNVYHVTCANLWLNCVNHNLPVLRYVSSHEHTNIAEKTY